MEKCCEQCYIVAFKRGENRHWCSNRNCPCHVKAKKCQKCHVRSCPRDESCSAPIKEHCKSLTHLENPIGDCSGCTDPRSEGTHQAHTKQHPCKEGGDPNCGYCFPPIGDSTQGWACKKQSGGLELVNVDLQEKQGGNIVITLEIKK